jgi:hypothetical protein
MCRRPGHLLGTRFSVRSTHAPKAQRTCFPTARTAVGRPNSYALYFARETAPTAVIPVNARPTTSTAVHSRHSPAGDVAIRRQELHQRRAALNIHEQMTSPQPDKASDLEVGARLQRLVGPHRPERVRQHLPRAPRACTSRSPVPAKGEPGGHRHTPVPDRPARRGRPVPPPGLLYEVTTRCTEHDHG